MTTSKQKRHLTTRQVQKRYGDCCKMTLWRWVHHPTMGFPKPTKYNARRNFFLESELDAYDEQCRVASCGVETTAGHPAGRSQARRQCLNHEQRKEADHDSL
jgi:predicted DNA-binding transcriptional regulator AlpA